MPITTFVTQPAANQIMAAYRPIVFVVGATRIDGNARPPVVYCDIYVNGVYYKTSERNQYQVLGASSSNWFFDIQDACQEVLTSEIGAYGGQTFITASKSIITIFCRFRSSGFDTEGFILAEGTPPQQGTGSVAPVSGTGVQSVTFYVINATLQHESAQNIGTHLNAFKTGVWVGTTYPLTHRTKNYRVCPSSSDYFSILSSNAPNCLRLHYRLKNQNDYTILNNCTGNTTTCVAVGISGSAVMPNGTVGAPYSFTLTLTGTGPFNIIDITGKPTWLNVPQPSGNTVTMTGTPTAGGTVNLSFTLRNCNNAESFSFSRTFTIGTTCVNVTAGSSIDLPDATIGIPYAFDVTLNGSPPYVVDPEVVPGWMTIGLNTPSGNILQFRGTPNFLATNTPVTVNVTNCSSGLLPIDTTINIFDVSVTWDFILPAGMTGSMRIVVNGNTAAFTNVSNNGTLSLNSGDTLEVVVLRGGIGSSIIDINGTITDAVTSSDHTISLGEYTLSSGSLNIHGEVTT